MKASFRFFSSLVLLLPLLSTVLASTSASDSVAEAISASTSPEGSKSEVVCHGEKCYPRVFVPAVDWQVIEPDQEIPPGLHIRLNMQTGIKEGKINVPGEGSEYEAVAVELAPNGGSDSVVVVGGEEAPAPSTKPPPPNDDSYGAIKVPITAQSEELPFTDAVSVILDSKSFSDSKLNEALSSLEGLVHEMYWGLQIATPKNINALLELVHTSTNPSVRKSAALVIGSALQNNPKALKNAIEGVAAKGGDKVEVKLIETLVVALEHETDDSARLRIMYALSQAIKSGRTYDDFIRIFGVRTLLELFQKADKDGGEFKGKVSTFVEDNFLNDDMKAELPQKEHHKHHAHQEKQKPLQGFNDARGMTGPEIARFCYSFQEALYNSESNGITSDEVKIKILNALVAMDIKYGESAVKCPNLEQFERWFYAQISGEKDLAKLEDAGEWFKIRALEVKDTLNLS